jgi:hypothetical protein
VGRRLPVSATTSKPVYRTEFIPWSNCSEARREMLWRAWRQGELSYKLSPAQFEVYETVRRWSKRNKRESDVFVLDIGRRFGKSSIMVCMAFEDAIRHPGWRILYIGPKKVDLMKFIDEHLSKMVLDCPPDIRPTWFETKGTYVFPNGSKIEFIGLDVNPDGARGGAFDLCLLDECAFFDNLENIMTSVLYPQMLGRPHALMVAGSTPPVSPSHYWSQSVVPEAKRDDACLTRTIDDSDIYPDEMKERFIRKLGGRRSARCRRELFTEHITDETLAIIPEFREVMDEVVKSIEAPYWRDCWTSMDPGWKDHTAVLFGYWHFELGALVVEDEVSAPRLHSAAIAEAIKSKEAWLWGKLECRKRGWEMRPQPYARVSDNDPRLLYDLSNDHGLAFQATAKDNLDQQINAVRVAISEKRIIIHPRCKMLRDQLKNGVWKNEAKKVFAREGQDLGHFDLIAALVYLWRNASMYKKRNPAPPAEKYVAGDLKVKDHGSKENGPSRWQRRGGRLFLKQGK